MSQSRKHNISPKPPQPAAYDQYPVYMMTPGGLVPVSIAQFPAANLPAAAFTSPMQMPMQMQMPMPIQMPVPGFAGSPAVMPFMGAAAAAAGQDYTPAAASGQFAAMPPYWNYSALMSPNITQQTCYPPVSVVYYDPHTGQILTPDTAPISTPTIDDSRAAATLSHQADRRVRFPDEDDTASATKKVARTADVTSKPAQKSTSEKVVDKGKILKDKNVVEQPEKILHQQPEDKICDPSQSSVIKNLGFAIESLNPRNAESSPLFKSGWYHIEGKTFCKIQITTRNYEKKHCPWISLKYHFKGEVKVYDPINMETNFVHTTKINPTTTPVEAILERQNDDVVGLKYNSVAGTSNIIFVAEKPESDNSSVLPMEVAFIGFDGFPYIYNGLDTH